MFKKFNYLNFTLEANETIEINPVLGIRWTYYKSVIFISLYY